MAEKFKDREVCPVMAVQRMVAGKWKLAILWQLSHGVKRFNELQRLLTEISQGILTQQLREMEKDGLIHREVYREVPPKVEYSLTPTGESFLPVLRAICQWGQLYMIEQEKLDGKNSGRGRGNI